MFGSDTSIFIRDTERYIEKTIELYGELVGDPETVEADLKRAKGKKKAQQEEHEKIKEYGESINEETRNKH